MRNLFSALTVCALLLGAGPVLAQRIDQLPAARQMPFMETPQAQEAQDLSEGIVAVVNDSIISTSDMQDRISLAALSAGLPDRPDVRKKLFPQVLRSLIDEQIQLQEGKKEGISISPEEIDQAMKRLAADNKIPGGDMTVFLRANGVPPQALRDQVRAALTWNKIVMRTVRPSINIGDDEIDAAVQRLRANAGKQEFLLSEIFLAVDKPEDETSAKALADNLVEQIKDGAVFGVVARQFSQGLGASNGGDLGWIQLGQLAPEIDKALAQMKKGDIVGPIRSANGYHILGLRDRRTLALGDSKDMSVHLQQLFHPFTADTRKETLLHQAADIRANTTSCDGLQQTIEQNYPSWRWQDLGDVALDKAPAWLADKVAPIEEGHATKAMATTKGALILFVCKRNMPENLDRNAIQRAIGTERLELMARRLQRDLRKDAFIDVRKKTPF